MKDVYCELFDYVQTVVSSSDYGRRQTEDLVY